MASHLVLLATLAAFAAGPVMAGETKPGALQDSATWDDLRGDVVGDAPLPPGDNLLTLGAPYRANDAATVPITLTQNQTGRRITGVTVVIDENPAPVAAVFSFSEAMGPLDFELRVRVDQYSNVRAIVETQEGLQMTGRFVKASGGCSAPASRDPAAALAGLGQMRLRSFDAAGKQSEHRSEAQVMVRHPNYSGLQRDQITQLFIPAHFIDHLEVWQGSEVLFTMEGGISISENPVFRFSYNDDGSPTLTVKATDTDGNSWENTLLKSAES